MRLRLLVLVGVCAVILAACGNASGGKPAEAVENYLRAKVEANREGVRGLLCASMEGDLDREAMSFNGIHANLKDMACKQGSAADSVTCTGVIVATYGTEQTTFPLGTYRVVQESGRWKWCGEAQ